jgi:hypothetical protein
MLQEIKMEKQFQNLQAKNKGEGNKSMKENNIRK